MSHYVLLGTSRLLSRSLTAARCFDRDTVKAIPVIGNLPWSVFLGNTAIQSTHREVDYFLPTVAEAEAQNPAIVFLGDSQSRYWRSRGKRAWIKLFAPLNAITLGVSGDRTQHLLFRLQSGVFENLSPRTVVLQIGTNNLNRNRPEEIAAAIQTLTCEIHHRWSRARLVVVAILPRELPRSCNLLRRIRETNVLLRQRIPESSKTSFVDGYEAFVNRHGWIKQDLFTDGLHLSEQGYAVLAPIVHAAL